MFSKGQKIKIKKATKYGIGGFFLGASLGSLVTWSIMNVCYTKEIAKISMQYATGTSSTQTNTGINNLLHEEANESIINISTPEVIISDIHQDNKDDSNLTSTTIKIANSKSKNTLISDAIARAEIREDGNLIKIVNVKDDIIKPHSIESVSLDFPVSTDAKELKIEVYSPLKAEPVQTKTFDLSSTETLE